MFKYHSYHTVDRKYQLQRGFMAKWVIFQRLNLSHNLGLPRLANHVEQATPKTSTNAGGDC